MKRFAFMLFAVTTAWVLCQTPTVAQASRAEPAPFTWKTSGETLKNFRVEVIPTDPPDYSSPADCVRSFLKLADGRQSMIDRLAGLDAQLTKIAAEEMDATLEMLLVDRRHARVPASLKHSVPANRLGGDWKLEQQPQVSELFKGQIGVDEDLDPIGDENASFRPGDAEVRVTQDESSSRSISTVAGKLELAFLCRMGARDRKWRIVELKTWRDVPIELIRQSGPPWQGLNIPWRRYSLPYDVLYKLQSRSDSDLDKDTILETGEAAVNSFFGRAIPRYRSLRSELAAYVLDAWLNAAKLLFVTESVEEMLLAARAYKDHSAAAADVEYEIIEQRDNPLSVVVQMNDPQKTSWVFSIKKIGESCQIKQLQRRFTAIRVRDRVEVEFLKDAESIWDVAKEPVLTSYRLPIFLVG